MKPIKVLELSEVDRLKLENGYHNGPTHSFRIRCKSILLKSEGKSAPKIAEMPILFFVASESIEL